MFTGKAEEAMNFYASIFPQTNIISIARYGLGEAGVEGSVMQALFSLNGQEFMCIDSSVQHAFTFTPSFSIFVRCETEAEQNEGYLMESNKPNFNSIDDYIASFPDERQKILEELRSTIKTAAPDAEEKISYNMPTFTLNGRLIYFAAWKNHIAIYGTPSTTLDALKDEVSIYRTDKGALQFPFDKPIPLDLISKIVEIGAAENRKKADAKSRKKS